MAQGGTVQKLYEDLLFARGKLHRPADLKPNQPESDGDRPARGAWAVNGSSYGVFEPHNSQGICVAAMGTLAGGSRGSMLIAT
jgi:hypothetical protein